MKAIRRKERQNVKPSRSRLGQRQQDPPGDATELWRAEIESILEAEFRDLGAAVENLSGLVARKIGLPAERQAEFSSLISCMLSLDQEMEKLLVSCLRVDAGRCSD